MELKLKLSPLLKAQLTRLLEEQNLMAHSLSAMIFRTFDRYSPVSITAKLLIYTVVIEDLTYFSLSQN